MAELPARPKTLSGIRVLDLTRLLPGPVCTLHLADFGADVIKIEDTGAGDYARTLGVEAGKTAPVFAAINRNKRALRLDLKKSEGVEIFLRLARNADAVVEGFRPGVVDRLGVGYHACRDVNPRIVYCAISGYGQDGPYRDRAGHDVNYCSYAGLTDQVGSEHGDPVLPNLQIADILGGAVVPAMSILAALLDAQRSGKGRYVDIAMMEGVLVHNLQALAAVRQPEGPIRAARISCPDASLATRSIARRMAATWRWGRSSGNSGNACAMSCSVRTSKPVTGRFAANRARAMRSGARGKPARSSHRARKFTGSRNLPDRIAASVRC